MRYTDGDENLRMRTWEESHKIEAVEKAQAQVGVAPSALRARELHESMLGFLHGIKKNDFQIARIARDCLQADFFQLICAESRLLGKGRSDALLDIWDLLQAAVVVADLVAR